MFGIPKIPWILYYSLGGGLVTLLRMRAGMACMQLELGERGVLIQAARATAGQNSIVVVAVQCKHKP